MKMSYKSENKSISILGCGWLGEPLADLLHEKGWKVKGSTTTRSKLWALKMKGIEAYEIKLGEIHLPDVLPDFLHSEYLVVNIPPHKGMREGELYVPFIKAIEASPVKKVILISTTSVYPDIHGEVTEDMADPNKLLFTVEQVFQISTHFETTVIRFGGLIGYDRHPGNFYFPGRHIPGPDVPVNMIHRDDCLGIITTILEKEVWGEVFNGVADSHPTKKEFYTAAAKFAGHEAPQFEEGDVHYKIVSNQKLKDELGYTFIYPDLMKLFEL
jgi:nucleoside-diphosphate-sugar epimerase